MSRYYVGLAASLHDPALAVLDPGGRPLFAEATERYLQNKRAYNCPPDDLVRAPRLIRELCPPEAELVLAVSWSEPMRRRLEGAVSVVAARGWGTLPGPVDDPFGWPTPGPELMLVGFRNSLSQAGLSLKGAQRPEDRVTLRSYDHHLAHAALAAYSSPFAECAVAVVDGYGEDRSTGFFRFAGNRLTPLPGQRPDSPRELRQHVSLGHFYARLCALCGFDPIAGEEWKVMGLAAYGSPDPELHELLRPLVQVEGLGLAAGCTDAELAQRLAELRRRARPAGADALAWADLAATGQRVFEERMSELLVRLHEAAPSENLALAGGCALNSSCNGRILERTPFRRLHVPSAPADDGCALGAALLAFCEDHPGVAPPPEVASPYLGSEVSATALAHLRELGGLGGMDGPGGVRGARRELPRLVEEVADLLAEGRIVGWMRGRAELGPRALGHRSILADPRRTDMKDRINARVKFREEFRPFAPAVLDEHGAEYFEGYQVSRYMERTLRFRLEKAAEVPAVVHVDGTGRLQSVRREWDPVFHDLVRAFYARTGVPLLLNTSLNVMGRPIVHSLEDALGVFFTTGLDALAVEDFLLRKDGGPAAAPARGGTAGSACDGRAGGAGGPDDGT